MNAESIKGSVREQFNRCAHHYLQNSPMGDRDLLRLIVRLAEPQPSEHLLDVSCGAGLLLCKFAPLLANAVGVDLSESMLAAARQSAAGLTNVSFRLADAECLPFADESFNIVTCKLALHYFPNPRRAIGEIKRVTRNDGRLILIDRISSEDKRKRDFQNYVEKLRTPSKIRVYSASEIAEIARAEGLSIAREEYYAQHQPLDEWLQSTGASEETQHRARELLVQCLQEDLADWKVRWQGGRLLLTHKTIILVAKKQCESA